MITRKTCILWIVSNHGCLINFNLPEIDFCMFDSFKCTDNESILLPVRHGKSNFLASYLYELLVSYTRAHLLIT